MRKQSGQVHSRESSATLQLTVSLLYQLENITLTNRKEKTYNIPKKGVQVMEEEMTAIEMQRFLNQQYAEGKTELEAYRNLMAILGLSYPQKSEKEK